MGCSTVFGEPVLDLIQSRMPVALIWTSTSIISWSLSAAGDFEGNQACTAVDNVSSILIFWYAIPGFALGSTLVYFGAIAGFYDWFDF